MKKPKKNQKATPTTTVNRRARFDYHLGEEVICGMVLAGPEVRAIRDNHVQLKGSFVTLRHGELWLSNLTLGSETARNIKLLATKKQIATFDRAKIAGRTLVPTKLFGTNRHIKLAVAVAEGKKKYDKRETIKKRDYERGKIR